MEYNYKEIGKRISAERKAAGYTSQDDFIVAINRAYYKNDDWETSNSKPGIIARNTLSAIENGKIVTFDLRVLTAMATVLDCEVGYILCEKGYENKTRRTTDIANATGLSEEAIQILNEHKHRATFISYILTSEQSLYLFQQIQLLTNQRKCENKQIMNGDKSALETLDDEMATLYKLQHTFTSMIQEYVEYMT
ncbi:MAG: hypothetical protein J6U71_02015 [Bacteroidales bacterium]|nr:hypothetical protein [Bacteroidales bacterium]